MNEKFQAIIDTIKGLSILELADLVKAIEEEFGVSAAPVAVAGPVAAAAPVEEKTEFDVVITAAGDKRTAVIKLVKDVAGVGLKEAKDFVDALPKAVKEGISKEDAEALKKEFEEAGATVEIK